MHIGAMWRRGVLLGILLMAGVLTSCSPPPTLSIGDAIKQNKITVSFINESNKSSGDIMVAKLKLVGR